MPKGKKGENKGFQDDKYKDWASERIYDDLFKQAKKNGKKMLEKMIEDNNLFRLQASVCLNDKKALRFIKWLRFKEEGIMRKFGPDGVDYMRYAWVK